MEIKHLSTTEKVIRLIALVFITLLAVASLLPLYWMITGSFKIQTSAMSFPPEWFPKSPTLENYRNLFFDKPTLRWLFNSIFVAGCISLGAILTSTMAGYAFGKKDFPGKSFLFWLMLGTMMLPHQVLLIPLFLMIVDMKLNNTYAGYVLPYIAYPLGVFLIKQYMQSVPNELLEAARIDGASELMTFRTVVVPLAKPAIGAIGIFAFILGWNEYLWQLVVADAEKMLTLPVAVSRLSQGLLSTNYGLAMAGATVAFIPMLIFFLVFQRFFVKGISVGALKG